MQIYDELQRAYDYFNKVLFDSKLDRCLMTLQRKTNTFAYISFNRFVSINNNQVFMHELALNPEYFGVKPLIEVMQSLCHEMVHLNQYQYGTPSRKSYHNTEFAEMMESIGLIPSDTGRVGGKRTGQQMADYPKPDGLFVRACNDLFKDGSIIQWYDRYLPSSTTAERIYSDLNFAQTLLSNNSLPNLLEVPVIKNKSISSIVKQSSSITIMPISSLLHGDDNAENTINISTGDNTLGQAKPVLKNKMKYTCSCNFNIWGKTGLDINCNICNEKFIEQ